MSTTTERQEQCISGDHDLHRLTGDPNWQELVTSTSPLSFMRALRIGSRETYHTLFLAWMVDPSEAHGLGDSAFRRLLDLVKQRGPQGAPIQSLLDHGYQILATEVAPEKATDGRMDIYIEAVVRSSQGKVHAIRVIVENKIEATESDEQTSRYWDAACELLQKHLFMSQTVQNHSHGIEDDHLVGLFLTPIFSEETCVCSEFLAISYQDVLDHVIEPALSSAQSPETRVLLDQYIRTLCSPGGGTGPIAVPRSMAVIYRQLWDAHKHTWLRLVGGAKKHRSKELTGFREAYSAELEHFSLVLQNDLLLSDEDRKCIASLITQRAEAAGPLLIIPKLDQAFSTRKLAKPWEGSAEGHNPRSKVIRRPLPNTAIKELRFYIGAWRDNPDEMNRVYMRLQYNPSIAGGAASISGRGEGHFVHGLRDHLAAAAIGSGAKRQGGLNLFDWEFSSTPEAAERDAHRCVDVVHAIVPLIDTWLERVGRSEKAR